MPARSRLQWMAAPPTLAAPPGLHWVAHLAACWAQLQRRLVQARDRLRQALPLCSRQREPQALNELWPLC